MSFFDITKSKGFSGIHLLIFAFVIILMSNLNAMVDAFLHPHIPYFDEEHLIVGGATGLVSSILFGLLLLYVRHLGKAVDKIKRLENFLSICSGCNKILKPGSSALQMESWERLEKYLSKKTDTKFSHGLCPECAIKLYPQIREIPPQN